MRNTLVGIAIATVACRGSSAPSPSGGSATAPSAPTTTAPCDVFAKTMSLHVSAVADREAIFAIAHKHCAGWPAETQKCLAATRDDDGEGQDRCMKDVSVLERATIRDELNAVMIDCRALDPLEMESPKWARPPHGVSAESWGEAEMTFGWLAEDECHAKTWPRATLICLQRDNGDPNACLGADRAAFEAVLAPAVDLWNRAAAAKPSSCEHVGAAWYSDATWRAHGAAGTAKAARAALITECQHEPEFWGPVVRSCMVLAKTDRERLLCGQGTNWGFPPLALDPPPKNICPSIETAEHRGLLCDSLPADGWDRAVDAIRKQHAAMSGPSPPPCRDDAVVARYAALGCKI